MQHSPQAVPGQIGKKSVLKGERNKRKPQSDKGQSQLIRL
jgi:hypothetical protein